MCDLEYMLSTIDEKFYGTAKSKSTAAADFAMESEFLLNQREGISLLVE
jgi:hypothetical protein